MITNLQCQISIHQTTLKPSLSYTDASSSLFQQSNFLRNILGGTLRNLTFSCIDKMPTLLDVMKPKAKLLVQHDIQLALYEFADISGESSTICGHHAERNRSRIDNSKSMGISILQRHCSSSKSCRVCKSPLWTCCVPGRSYLSDCRDIGRRQTCPCQSCCDVFVQV